MTEAEILRLRALYVPLLVELLRRALREEIDEVVAVGIRGVREDRWVSAFLTVFERASSDAWDRTEREIGAVKAFPSGADVADAIRRVSRRARAVAEANRRLLARALAESGSNLTAAAVERFAGLELNTALTRDAANAVVESLSWGQNQAALASGAKILRVWMTRADDKVRGSHVSVAGQERPMGIPFDLEGGPLDFPGDSSGPIGEWINCRCFLDMVPLVRQGPAGSPSFVFADR